jgi:archaetidylinositol phosphate synthase
LLFVAINGFLDGLDGKIARMKGKQSAKGDFIDHAMDRYSDVAIIGGIALSQWCDNRIGLIAIVGILLTSYMGTQSQAVGYQREYGGLLGRVDRIVILMIALVIQCILLYFNASVPFGQSFLEWMMIYFAIAGNATAIQRFIKVMKWFEEKNEK